MSTSWSAAVAAAPIVGYNVGVGNDEKIREPPRAARRLTAGLLPFVHTGGLMRILTYITTEEDAGARRERRPPPVSARHTRLSSAQGRGRHPLRRRAAARGHGSARGAAAGNPHRQRRNRNHSRNRSQNRNQSRARRPAAVLHPLYRRGYARRQQGAPLTPPAAISTPGRSASSSPPCSGRTRRRLIITPSIGWTRATSGLLCVARHAHAQRLLTGQLHTDSFIREYLAVTEGVPAQRGRDRRADCPPRHGRKTRFAPTVGAP